MKNFKRRQFIKVSTSATLALSSLPIINFSGEKSKNEILLKDSFVLKGFDDELEESPSLVSNGEGEIWLFSLRRLSFPTQLETISCFRLTEDGWKETEPATKNQGMYENLVASCANGGKPFVAYSQIDDGKWYIKVSKFGDSMFENPFTFSSKSGRSINPVLITPNKKKAWIAYESFEDGIFSIKISKYINESWSESIEVKKEKQSVFHPALAEAKNGDLHVAYTVTEGFHKNIELAIIDGISLKLKNRISVAIGGGHKDRVNINNRPAIAFDKNDRLWISYENNRDITRFEDGDNYTGDRCCAILSYENGKIVEIEGNEKWLFRGENDHNPKFVKDIDGNLFLFTNSGGTFDARHWKCRVSWLDAEKGWKQPQLLLQTNNQGFMVPPAVVFDKNNDFYFSTVTEKFFRGEEINANSPSTMKRLSEVNISSYSAPKIPSRKSSLKFSETVIKEYTPDKTTIGPISGHPHVERRKKIIEGIEYTLLYGNLHEHSNSSNCWPAGTDGTLDDDYRFGMYSEGYDFFGMTDHAGSTSEIHWRKNIRIADFYNESEKFVAIPAIEWTLPSNPKLDDIQKGAGHYNIIFNSTEDALKYIRNKDELFCPRTPETNIAPNLWKMLREKDIKCLTIPHHTADKVHPVDWNVTDPKYVTTVEIFQCRGNNEYPGCPREINLSRHTTTEFKRAFINYALMTKKYKLGFIASGDHNNMGNGVAALWVKEISREGILDALRNRRTFATTGDKMFIDISVNEALFGSIANGKSNCKIKFEIEGQYDLLQVEILRNSKVIKQFDMDDNTIKFSYTYTDASSDSENEVLYYYVRATQKNNAIAWSSPIWVE
jgi:hypothetical protein